jgi:hypothetical protein
MQPILAVRHRRFPKDIRKSTPNYCIWAISWCRRGGVSLRLRMITDVARRVTTNDTNVTKRGQIGRARAQRSGNRFRGLRAGVLPRRTPRARRGQEEIVVGHWMVTTSVVMDFAVRR